MSRQRSGMGLILATMGIAFALALWPLPEYLTPFRPNWMALALCYWLLEAPDRVGLGVAFLLGLVADQQRIVNLHEMRPVGFRIIAEAELQPADRLRRAAGLR